MKLSTSSLHYRSLPLLESLRRISALGYEGVDIWAHFEWAGPLCEHLEEAVERSTAERFMETLRELKLTLNSASCYTVPFARFAPLLGACGGCVVVRGSQGVADENITGADLVREMKQFLESLKPDLELAEKHQCVLAVENHSGRSLLNKLESFQVFTDLNQNPRLGIALAPFHVQANKESVVDAIRHAGSQLKFFYAWQYADLADEARQEAAITGHRTDRHASLARALAAIDYAGFVNPFMHYEPEPAEMDVVLEKEPPVHAVGRH